MKKTLLVLGLLLLICSTTLLAQGWTPAQKEVWSVEEKYNAALLRGDVDGFMSLMHPDYRGLNHGTSLPIDKTTFRKAAEENIKKNKLTFVYSQPLAVQVFGTGATAHYIFTTIAKGSDGKEVVSHNVWTDILAKQGDQWLVIADNGNVLSEMPITTASPEALQAYLDALTSADDVNLAKSQSFIETALQKDPNLALAYLMRGDLGEATELAAADRVKAMSLRYSGSLGERFMILYTDFLRKGSVGQAKPYLDSLLLFFPYDKRVQMTAANYYAGVMGDIPTGIKYMEEATKIDPKFAGAYNQLGGLYSLAGKKDAAEEAYKKYVTLKPDVANSHDSYAEFLRTNSRYDESIAEYQKALALDPAFANSIRGIGDCYLKKGEFAKALEQYQLAANKSSMLGDKYTSFQKHALTHVMQGNIAEAVSALEEAKESALKDNFYNTALNQEFFEAYVLSAFGQQSEGAKKMKEAIKLAKSLAFSDEVRDSWLTATNYLLAYNALEAKDLKKAKDYIATFQKDVERRKNPNEMLQLKSLQAYLDLQEARLDDAISKFSSLPEDPPTLHALAVAYTQKGDKEKAQAALDKLNKWPTIDLTWAIESRQATMNRGI